MNVCLNSFTSAQWKFRYQTFFKRQFFCLAVHYKCAPGGQIKEDFVESYVTHWHELENQDQVQQRQELGEQAHNLSEPAEAIGGEDHNNHHRTDYWYSVD